MKAYILLMITGISGVALAGCAGGEVDIVEAENEATVLAAKDAYFLPARATVKPGAAIEIRGEADQKVAAGQNGQIKLKMIEGYDSGTVETVATASEGLEVFGAQVSTRFNASGAAAHEWAVSYQAETDGVYYVHIHAAATPESGPALSRVQSFRVEIGDGGLGKSMKTNGDLSRSNDGEAVVVMEANETID